MKKDIDVYEYGTQLQQALSTGVLLNSKANGTLNTMTISWGSLGTCWGKPTFVTYVRTGRYTHELLEQNGNFTVSVPYGDFDRSILGRAGTITGRGIDKPAQLGLTPFPATVNGVDGFKELPLTLECRVVYKQTFDLDALAPEIQANDYPADVPSTASGSNHDPHTAYYGQIVAAYIEQ